MITRAEYVCDKCGNGLKTNTEIDKDRKGFFKVVKVKPCMRCELRSLDETIDKHLRTMVASNV